MPRSRRFRTRPLAAALLVLTLPLLAQSSPEPAKDDPSMLPSEKMERASRSLLLDIVQTTGGMYAVGERGHVLSSTDGKTWTQLPTNTRSTLTTVASADGQLWAAGHDGVIVHSTDGGQTWGRQRAAPWMPEAENPDQGVPILDLLFTDSNNGFAIGAYSLMLVTHDSGVTWTRQTVNQPGAAAPARQPDATYDDTGLLNTDELELGEESDPHLNAIARTGSGALVIVGERGTFLRSRDNGATWQKASFPYQGSMFGVLAWDGEHILAYGLRGNAYESDDLGTTWRKLDTQVNASLMGGEALPNGGAVLVGATGVVLTRKDAGSPFVASTYQNAAGETPVLSGALAQSDGSTVLIGEKGADRYQPK